MHSYFGMFTDNDVGVAAVLLSYAVFLTMLPASEVGMAIVKSQKIIKMDSAGPTP